MLLPAHTWHAHQRFEDMLTWRSVYVCECAYVVNHGLQALNGLLSLDTDARVLQKTGKYC